MWLLSLMTFTNADGLLLNGTHFVQAALRIDRDLRLILQHRKATYLRRLVVVVRHDEWPLLVRDGCRWPTAIVLLESSLAICEATVQVLRCGRLAKVEGWALIRELVVNRPTRALTRRLLLLIHLVSHSLRSKQITAILPLL